MQKLKKFVCLLPAGHVGAGRYDEQKHIIYAKNAAEAMKIAMKRGGIKKGKSKVRGFLAIKEEK